MPVQRVGPGSGRWRCARSWQTTRRGRGGTGQTDKQKVTALRQHLLAERLVAVPVIPQVGDAPRGDPRRPQLLATGAGGQLTVLLAVVILRRDERGGEREHGIPVRSDQD